MPPASAEPTQLPPPPPRAAAAPISTPLPSPATTWPDLAAMDHSQVQPTTEGVPEARMVVDVPVTVAGGQPTPGEVAAMVSATMPGKRKQAVYQPQAEVGATPAAAAPAVAAAAVTPAPPKTGRSKTKSAGPRGNPPSKAKAANRVGLAPPLPKAAVPPPFIPLPPPQAVNDAHNVFGDSSTTEFLSALNDSSVDVADGIPPFDEEIGDEEYDEEIGDEEVDDDVVEIEPGVAQQAKPRSSNYTEIEDVTLIRAWGKVGLDAVTGTDQTGKRYWQRIEDLYHKLKPRTKLLADRSYRSLQGWWDVIKPCCSRWSAAMDQVRDNPPSGCVPEDYVSCFVVQTMCVIIL
ncbi:hypothetical protein ACQ4PT_068493 [Festuca glaucescens]